MRIYINGPIIKESSSLDVFLLNLRILNYIFLKKDLKYFLMVIALLVIIGFTLNLSFILETKQ